MKIVDGKYVYKTKPTVCKSCGARKIATFFYGYPNFTPELDQALNNNEVILMGCCIDIEEGLIQKWTCTECDQVFYTE